MSFRKKIPLLFILLLLIGVYIFPIFVFAQTISGATKEPPMQCWPKSLCKGIWSSTKSPGCIDFNGEETRYCYTLPPDVKLQVSIGGTQVKGLLDYIPRVYNYMVAVVSIVAVIMIMVGGLQYLTSAGNPSAIGSAKERILGAIVGLFLTLGSYFLLNTINPALTQLKLPPIKMVRQSALTKQGQCGEAPTAKLGNQCKNTCECEQGSCISIEEGALEAFTGALVKGSLLALNVWAIGGGSVAAGAKTIYIISKKAILGLSKFVVKHPYIAAGATGYSIYKVATDESVERGICMVEANRNVPAGGWCEKDEHCTSGKCFITITSLGNIPGAKGIGVCAGGSNGSPCENTTSNPQGNCDNGLTCVDSSDGEYIKQCTDRKAGSPCETIIHCLDTINYECKSPGTYLPKKCTLKAGTKITYLTSCLDSTGQKNDALCGDDATWSCINGLCSQRKFDHNCFDDGFTPEPCKTGFTCAFDYEGSLIKETGAQADYQHNSDLLNFWKLVHGESTVCQSADNVKNPSTIK